MHARLCLAGSCTQRDHRVHGRICFTSFAVKEPGRNIGLHGRHCFAECWFQRDIRVHGRDCFTWFAARVAGRRFTRFEEKRLGETRACVHAFISLGGRLSETFASVDAFVSPNLQGDGLPDRAQRGVYLARASCGRSVRQSSSSTASDAKWCLVQSMCWMLRNSIALTSSRREFRIGCGIIQMKRINRTASGNKIRI